MESTRDHQPLLENAQASAGSEPRRVLESLVCELECLLDDAPTAVSSPFIELFGALLVFNLDGRADLVPSPSIGLSGHALRTWRVARSARRVAALGHGDRAATVRISAALIEHSIHLIDPELRAQAA